ncbi:MAG TPA: hypothetical protein VNG13_14495 [Mycobacteriales bacterium]|nr:hypothetical protein [Mycobacteriales bacterium]
MRPSRRQHAETTATPAHAVGDDPPAAPETISDEKLSARYLHEGLSIRQIAELLRTNRAGVARRLRTIGVPVGARGAGHPRLRRRRPDPPTLAADLVELYWRQRLTSAQVADKLGLPERLVRERLKQLGIPTRTRGWANREDRQRLPAGPLRSLYVAQGLTASEIGERLGRSRREVLFSAHDHNLPVRPGGTNVGQNRSVRVLASLYADPQVRRVLAHHRVPVVDQPGPLHQRFPCTVPLDPGLIRDLYVGCGLAVVHLEMLTGVPAGTIRRRMAELGLARRPAGGLSPFIRRQRRLRRHTRSRPRRVDALGAGSSRRPPDAHAGPPP